MNCLTRSEIARLREFQRKYHVDRADLLARAMGGREERPFSWRVLDRALKGGEILADNLAWIRRWMAEHCPEPSAVLHDGKAAAAGEREE